MLGKGSIIGNYEIVEPIAAGGMGVVFHARHRFLHKDVAIKELSSHLAINERVRARFQQEAYVQSKLEHPGVVNVHDFLMEQDSLAIVMELVSGPSLEQVIQHERPMPWSGPETMAVMGPVIRAIAHAHELGVVHRDLKPPNVLLDRARGPEWPGRPCITDFGLAKILQSGGGLTQVGTMMGTVPYMAPEQFRGQLDADARADVFALGMLLWRLLTGRLPVNPDDMVEVADVYTGSQSIEKLADLRPDIPSNLSDIVACALSVDAASRPPSAAALESLLAGCDMAAIPRGANPPPPAAGGGGVAADLGPAPISVNGTTTASGSYEEVPRTPVIPVSSPSPMFGASIPPMPGGPGPAGETSDPDHDATIKDRMPEARVHPSQAPSNGPAAPVGGHGDVRHGAGASGGAGGSAPGGASAPPSTPPSVSSALTPFGQTPEAQAPTRLSEPPASLPPAPPSTDVSVEIIDEPEGPARRSKAWLLIPIGILGFAGLVFIGLFIVLGALIGRSASNDGPAPGSGEAAAVTEYSDERDDGSPDTELETQAPPEDVSLDAAGDAEEEDESGDQRVRISHRTPQDAFEVGGAFEVSARTQGADRCEVLLDWWGDDGSEGSLELERKTGHSYKGTLTLGKEHSPEFAYRLRTTECGEAFSPSEDGRHTVAVDRPEPTGPIDISHSPPGTMIVGDKHRFVATTPGNSDCELFFAWWKKGSSDRHSHSMSRSGETHTYPITITSDHLGGFEYSIVATSCGAAKWPKSAESQRVDVF